MLRIAEAIIPLPASGARGVGASCSIAGARYASAVCSDEENHSSLQMATAVSSGARSVLNHKDRADHASPLSGIFSHSSASVGPTQGMKYDAISGLTLKPAIPRVTMIARPVACDGRHGKIRRPCGRSALSHDSGGVTTPALT